MSNTNNGSIRQFTSKEELRDFIFKNVPIMIRAGKRSKYPFISPYSRKGAMDEIVNGLTDRLWEEEIDE